MYGAVSGTSRRLGVRQAPLRLGSGVAPQLGATAMSVVAQGSPPSDWPSLQIESRRKPFSASLSAPAQAPDGKQLAASAPGAQLQVLEPAGQSSTVGT